MFHNLCDFIKEELREIDRKVASGGKLSMNEIEYADKLAHLKKSLLTVDAMEHPEEYSYWDDGNRGRMYGARGRMRDSMGQNMTGSRTYRDDGMMGELYELMNSAPNEQIKHKYREIINDMQNMM